MFKNNVVCMILKRNVITLLRIFILCSLSVSGTESVGTILHDTVVVVQSHFCCLILLIFLKDYKEVY